MQAVQHRQALEGADDKAESKAGDKAGDRARDRGVSPSALAGLSRVGRQTLHDRVYGELRRLLIEGSLDAGEVLRIQDVAARLDVSTMPVREAFGRLVSERALEALPNRSVRVPLLTRVRLDEVAHARVLVEGEAVALATPRMTHGDFVVLRDITDAYERLLVSPGTHTERAAYNHRFHFTLYRAAGSTVLIPIIESLWLQSGPFIRASARIYDGDDGLTATHHHWQIIDAMERGDIAQARMALGADINRAFDLLRERVLGPVEDLSERGSA